MIEEILPKGVIAVDSFDDVAPGGLLDGEEAVIANAVDKRRREFTTARACARRALGGLGLPPVAIGRDEKGAPQWPAGVVGSITHCDGYRAAAVAYDTDIVTIGIDAEPHGDLPDGVLEAIALPDELAVLPGLGAAAPQICWDRLLFSAKESIYKAWYPLARRWLGFEEAVITPDRTGGFSARILVEAPEPLRGELRGRWMVREGLVVTALTLTTG